MNHERKPAADRATEDPKQKASAAGNAAAVLERVSRGLLAVLLFAAPLLLGYPRPGGYHWLEDVARKSPAVGWLTELSGHLSEYEFPLMLAHLWVCLVALLVLVASGLRNELAARLDLIGMGTVAFLVATGLATLCSVSVHDSLVELTRVFDAVAVYFLVRRLCQQDAHRSLFMCALLAGGFVAAAQGVRHYVWTVAELKDTSWREFGPFGNPNSFAGYLLLMVPLAVGLFLSARDRLTRLVLAFAILIASVALFLTGSKGGILAFLLSMLAFAALVAWPWARGSRRRKLALVALCLLPIVVALLLPQVRHRFLAAFTTESHSGAFRLYTWLATWKMFLARPWLGWGPGSFADVFPQFAIAGFTRLAHNKDLQIAAEGGLLALLPLAFVFIAYLLRGLAATLRAETAAQRAMPAALFAGVLGFCLHSLVDYDWYIPAICLAVWAMMGLRLAPEVLRAAPESQSRGTRKARRREMAARGPRTPPISLQVAFSGLVAVVFGVLVAFGALELAATLRLHAARLAQPHQPVRAEDDLRRSAVLSPLNPEPHFQLGLMYQGLGLSERSDALLRAARREFRWAGQLEPTVARAYVHLSSVTWSLRDPGGAVQLAEQAWERAPRDPKLIAELARLYRIAEREAEADRMYRRLHDLWDSPARKYSAIEGMVQWEYALAWIYFHQRAKGRGDEAEAQRWLGRAFALFDQYEAYVQTQRPMLETMGKWPPQDLEVVRALRRAFGGEQRSEG